MSKALLQTLNYQQAAQAVAACLRAKKTALLLGAPGVGKTSMVKDAAQALGKKCVILIASNMDPTDVAGLPYRGEDGRVHRALFPELQEAVDNPVVLCIDEATTMPKSVEGPMLRVALERNAGGQQLHPGTSIVMCANPPEQAPGGIELSAALINRVVLLLYSPSITDASGGPGEVMRYFFGDPVKATANVLDEEELEKTYRNEAADLAATLTVESLVQMDPPRASIDAGEPWGSPRGWEIGLRAWAAHGAQEDSVGHALLAGAVGATAASAFLAIRKLREKLPTVQEIASQPATAKVPDDRSHQIALLGLVVRVAAEIDVWASWIFTERLSPEISMAAARSIMRYSHRPTGKSRFEREGQRAMEELLMRIGQMTKRR